MPRAKKKEFNSLDHQGQTRKAIPAAEGNPGFDVEPIEVVDGPKAGSYADELAFNEEVLTIVVHNDANPKEQENPVFVSVNGRNCFIPRGPHCLIKRKYVEVLLRAQADSVQQNVYATEEREFNKLTIVPTQRYPISIINDPNPRGPDWARKICEQR